MSENANTEQTAEPATAAEVLGLMTMELLQERFDEARKLAMGVPLSFQSGKPVAVFPPDTRAQVGGGEAPLLSEEECQLIIGAIPLQALPDTPQLADHVQCLMDAVVDAAVEWRQCDKDWLDKGEALTTAIDNLLAVRDKPEPGQGPQ